MTRQALRDDLTGRRFGELCVTGFAGIGPRRNSTWLCSCSCGATKIIARTNLIQGHARSCGCKNIESFVARSVARNRVHGKSGTRTHDIWQGMWKRCTNPNTDSSAYYIGRGITVCDAWKDFRAFLADMGEAPIGCSIDRINNDAGYSKDNCRWATATQQSRNARSKHGLVRGVHWHIAGKRWQAVIAVNGVSKSLGLFDDYTDAVTARISAEHTYWSNQHAA